MLSCYEQVIDFGSSEFVQPGQEVARAFGTVRYCSPEMANDSAGQKSDVWSAGIVMYHMLGGKPPFLKVGAVGFPSQN